MRHFASAALASPTLDDHEALGASPARGSVRAPLPGAVRHTACLAPGTTPALTRLCESWMTFD